MSHSEAPPAWAMEKARGIVAKRFAADSKTVAIALSGAMDQHEPDILDIARAIAEADKAATERERERCARIAESPSLIIECEVEENARADAIAAAMLRSIAEEREVSRQRLSEVAEAAIAVVKGPML